MLALVPSGESLRHQIDKATTTPGRVLSVTRAVRTSDPRSLKTRTRSPAATPLALASSGWISNRGTPSDSVNTGRLAKVELSALRAGGEMIASGNFCARTGLLEADSRGGVKAGSGSSPTLASFSE